MTTTADGDLDTEVLLLDALLEETPRCQMVWKNMLTGLERQCFRPAGVRLRVTCAGCGKVLVHFYCLPCWDEVRAGNTECGDCGSSVAVTGQL